MFIPTGPEYASLRRVPWASLSLMAITILVFLISRFWSDLPSPLPEAMSYRIDHPYLEASPTLDALIGRHTTRTSRGPKEKPGIDQMDREQQTLDRLTREGLAAWEAMPTQRRRFQPAKPDMGSLVSHIFYHRSVFHMVINLLIIFLCGLYLEDRWGRVFFPIFYLFSGMLSAGLPVLFLSRDSFFISGASGATAAILGAYMVRYPHVKLRLWRPSLLWPTAPFSISPHHLFPSWLALEILFAYLAPFSIGSGRAVVWTHLFGFLFGAGIAWMIKHNDWETRLYADAYDRLPQEERIEILRDHYLEENNAFAALTLLRDAAAAFPQTFSQAYWDQAVRMGRAAEARSTALQLIRERIQAGDFPDAFFVWQELTSSLSGANIGVEDVNRLAMGLLATGEKTQVQALFEYTVVHLPSGLPFNTLLALVETASHADDHLCAMAIEKVRRLGNATPEQALRLEAIRRVVEPGGDEEGLELSPLDPNPGTEEDPFAPTRIRALKVHQGKPKCLNDKGLLLLLPYGRERMLPLTQIKALAVGAIRGIGRRPYLLLDLLTDDPGTGRPHHDILRLHTNQFDPGSLVPGTQRGAPAMRTFLSQLLSASEAEPLPDRETLLGDSFPTFGSVAEYEESVFGVASR